MTSQNKLLTISEASELLNVSKASLRRWSNSGQLRCYRIGDRSERRFDLKDLLDFVTDASGQAFILDKFDAETDSLSRSTPAQASAHQIQRRHVCTFYKNPREQWQLFRPHFLAHMAESTRTVYLYHGDKNRVINWIKSEGLNLEDLQDRGTVQLLSTAETYCIGGFFNTDRMLDFWRKIVAGAKQSGVERLLLTGEMGWANTNLPGHEQLVPYEAVLDHMLELYPWVTVVCQYPVYQISGATVYDNLCVHTHVQLPDRLAPGFIAEEP